VEPEWISSYRAASIGRIVEKNRLSTRHECRNERPDLFGYRLMRDQMSLRVVGGLVAPPDLADTWAHALVWVIDSHIDRGVPSGKT
jgi:hypothetical protein